MFPHEPEVDPRLLEHPRVVVTPHIADYQPEVYGALTEAVVAGLERVFAAALSAAPAPARRDGAR